MAKAEGTAPMELVKTSASIIRSIRQVSLNREWTWLRRGNPLPKLADFKLDARYGDADYIAVDEVRRSGSRIRYLRIDSGRRVSLADGMPTIGRYLDEFLPSDVIVHAQPIWNACVEARLPVYSLIPLTDGDGNPLTLEHLYLPFTEDDDQTKYLMTSFNFFSDQSHYRLHALVRDSTALPEERRDFLIDPNLTFAETVQHETDIEFVEI